MITLLKALALTGGEWVIYILLLSSVVAVAVMIERAILLKKERKSFIQVKIFFQETIGNTDLKSKFQEIEKFSGVSARVIASAVSDSSNKIKAAEEKINSVIFEQKQRLETRLLILGTLGNNAVYIGLFGTVLGVIKAFHDLAQEAGAGPEVVMQGLSEALIATAVGLMVAIPCVVAYNVFQKIIKDLISESENMAREILVRLYPE